MTEKVSLDNQLTRAWNARWNQDQVLWRIFGAFWPTNAILLAALFRSGDTVLPHRLTILTCLIGVFVAGMWFFIEWRAIANIERLEDIAHNLEKELFTEDGLKKYALSPKHSKKEKPPWTARRVIKICIGMVGAGWLAGLLVSLCR